MKKLLVLASTIAVSIVSLPVLAQSRFVDVSGGRETILLDTTSIKGTQFNLIDKSAEGFTIERYQVNCQNKIFVLLAVRVYDANQKLVLATDDEPTNPRRYGDNTPVGRSAAIVCPTR